MKSKIHHIMMSWSVLALIACSTQSDIQLTNSEVQENQEMYIRTDVPTNLQSQNGVEAMRSTVREPAPSAIALTKRPGATYVTGVTATDISVLEGISGSILYRTAGGIPDAYGNFPIAKATSMFPKTWQNIPGEAVRLDAGPNYLWVVQHSGAVYRYNYAAGTWQGLLEAGGRDIAVNKKNDLSVILWGNADSYGNFAIYKGNSAGTSWTLLPGEAYRLSVDAAGRIWVIQWNGNVYYYDGSWRYVGNPAPNGGNASPDISVWGGPSAITVAIVAKDGYIYTYGYWTNYRWEKDVNTGSAVATPGLALDTYWAVDDVDQIVYSIERPVGL